jgi:integrase
MPDNKAAEPGRRDKLRRSAPKLRDGVMKRGSTWSYVIRVPDPASGASKPKWVGGFGTEEAAKAARDEARIRARRGEYVNRSVSTVADYLAEWLEAHAATVKPKTLAGYRHDIEHYIVPCVGHMRLQALRPAVISKLYRDLAEHGGRDGGPLSAWTISHIHRTLRKALADAVQVEQLLAVNPAERSKRPRHHAPEPVQVWTTEQLDSFLSAARSHRLYAFYRLAAYTGARRGELLYLRWAAVDLDGVEVTFGGSTAVVRGQRVEGTTKGGRSRVVSIDRDTVSILRDHRRRQAEERQAAGSAWTDNDGLVFTTKWGEPLYPDTVTALMNKLITAYNKSVASGQALPHARLHDLRHLHATTLLLAGVPVHVVAARLGHADPAVTLRVYSHVLREHALGVGDAFARAVEASVSKSVSKPGGSNLASKRLRWSEWWSGAGSNCRPSAFQADAHTD